MSSTSLQLLSLFGEYRTKQEQDAYLYRTLLSNIDYYRALARYRHLKQLLHDERFKRKGTMWRKQIHFRLRLTERGLVLLKTGYAKKPKSPV